MFDYFINTTAYAKNCENKARPILHCNGKCQMMKKLKEEEKKEQQNPERKAENKNELFFFSGFTLPVINHLMTEEIFFFTPLYIGAEIKMPRYIFHPPDRLS